MLPEAFIDRLRDLVPADRLATVLASFSADKPPCLWLSPLRATPDAGGQPGSARPSGIDATRAELAAHLDLVPLFDDAVLVRGATTADLSRLPAVTEGRAYLINPSSLMPPRVLDPARDDTVLDLCAAPGGKTLQLAARLARTPDHPTTAGHLAAVEAVKPRFFKLQGILNRYGALANPGVRLFLKDGRGVGGAVPERFDKVLLDAPCSSEARFDADDDATSKHWSAHKIAECAFKQRALLLSALQSLKVGGAMVYCTCSFAPEENEDVVRSVLAEFDGAAVAVPSSLPALAPDAPAVPAVAGLGLPEAWRILPDGVWDGFFLVRLEKKSSIETADSNVKRNTSHRGAGAARRPRR